MSKKNWYNMQLYRFSSGKSRNSLYVIIGTDSIMTIKLDGNIYTDFGEKSFRDMYKKWKYYGSKIFNMPFLSCVKDINWHSDLSEEVRLYKLVKKNGIVCLESYNRKWFTGISYDTTNKDWIFDFTNLRYNYAHKDPNILSNLIEDDK